MKHHTEEDTIKFIEDVIKIEAKVCPVCSSSFLKGYKARILEDEKHLPAIINKAYLREVFWEVEEIIDRIIKISEAAEDVIPEKIAKELYA